MAKTVWALDLGEWSLKIARSRGFDKSTGKITVDLLEIIRYSDLPCGYEAHVTERYQEGIRAFLERYKVQKNDRVCISITGHEIFNRFINLPPVPMKRVAEIAPYEARQQIPFNIDEVVWDYQPVKTEPDVGEEIEIGLFAIKRERVNEFMEMMEPIRANLECIQAAPLALYNFLHHEELSAEPMVVLDVGAHSTDLLVLDYPKFWLRCVLVAGDNLTMAIQQKFNVSKEEAETIKERAGGSTHSRQIYDVVRPVVRNVVSEVQRSLGYYKSVASEVKFDKVLGLGGSFKLEGMDKLVAESMQYEIISLEEFHKFDFAAGVDQETLNGNRSCLGVVLGLLVQGYGQGHMKINLLPYEVVKETMINKKKPFLLAGSVGLLLICIFLYIGNKIMAGNLAGSEGQGVQTEQQVKELEGSYQNAKGEVDRAVRPIDDLMEPKFNWAELDVNEPSTVTVKNVLEMGWNRYMWVQLFPTVAKIIPKDQVFVTDMRTDWMTEAEIKDEIKKNETVGPTNRRGSIWGQQPQQPPEEKKETEEEEAKRGPTKKGMNTRLIVFIDGESLSRRKEFIQQELIDKLAKFELEGIPVPCFKQALMLGTPRIIFRDPVTGANVDEASGRKQKEYKLPNGMLLPMDYERYLQFRAMVTLKTDAEMFADLKKYQTEKKNPKKPKPKPAGGLMR